MSYPTSQILRALLVREGICNLPTTVGAPWPCYVAAMPAEDASVPANALCVYDRQGAALGRLHKTQEVLERAAVQISVRALSYIEGHRKVHQLEQYLDSVLRLGVAIDEDAFTIPGIMRSPTMPLGLEDEKKRHTFSINATVQIRIWSLDEYNSVQPFSGNAIQMDPAELG